MPTGDDTCQTTANWPVAIPVMEISFSNIYLIESGHTDGNTPSVSARRSDIFENTGVEALTMIKTIDVLDTQKETRQHWMSVNGNQVQTA